MLRILLLAVMLLPIQSWACGPMSKAACQRLSALVADRMHAITISFGDLAPIMPHDIDVQVMKRSSPEYQRYTGRPGYDPEQRTLFLPYALVNERLPAAGGLVREYWPFYRDERLRETFQAVHQIDAALWDAYLQEAARLGGLTWPHADCKSPDSARRLPCEMIANGVAEYVNRPQQRIFNTNQIERIWPADYAKFTQQLWQNDNREATNVKRYGGLLLLRPLVEKFGVPRALAYIARTPFQVEQNSLQLSALHFQERALQSTL